MRIWPFVLALLFALLLMINACSTRHVGHGERVGTIIKFAQEGFFFKTTEVEIIRGGINAGQGGFGVKPFFATVNDPRLASTLQSAFDSQREVKITYDEYMYTPFSSECQGEGENCAFVTSVEFRQ